MQIGTLLWILTFSLKFVLIFFPARLPFSVCFCFVLNTTATDLFEKNKAHNLHQDIMIIHEREGLKTKQNKKDTEREGKAKHSWAYRFADDSTLRLAPCRSVPAGRFLDAVVGQGGGGGLHGGGTLSSLVVLEVAPEGTQGVERIPQLRLNLQGTAVMPHSASVVAAGPQQVSVQQVGGRLSNTREKHCPSKIL